jgi:hypothetical protein
MCHLSPPPLGVTQTKEAIMTKSAHTPGPWDITPNGSAIYDDQGTVICLLKTEVTYIPEMEANAHLLAASPQLLKALEAAEQAIEEAADIMHAEDGQPVTALEGWEIERAYLALCGVLVEVDQAITTARGHQRRIAHTPALLAAVELVIARWNCGDLAEAVRLLDHAVIEAKRGAS